MQISASQSYAANSYQQAAAQPQQNTPVAAVAQEAGAQTSAPLDTASAVRPSVRASDSRSSVEDYKRDERSDVANDRGDAARPQAAQGRGQIVDIRA